MLSPTFLLAQVEKGDRAMTYSVAYIQNDNFKFGLLSAKLGRYVSKSLEIGMKPQIDLGGGGDLTMFNLGVGLYATYNFLTDGGKVLPYLGGEVVGKGGTITTGDIDTEINTGQADAGAYVGMKYFMTERLNFDVSLSYSFNLYNYAQVGAADPTEDPDFPETFALNFGIGFLLEKKNK